MNRPRSMFNETQKLLKNQLKIVEIYEEYCVPGKTVTHFYNTNRNTISIHYVFTGRGLIYIGGKSFVIGEGQSFYVPPYDEVKYVADLREPWHYFWVAIEGPLVDAVAEYIGFSRNKPIINADRRKIMPIYLRMLDRKVAHDMGDLEFLSDVILLINALAKDHTHTKDTISKHVSEAVTYINNNYMNAISLSDISTNVNLNPRYLIRLFKKELNKTPIAYINDKRIHEAQLLLLNTDIPIKEVSRRTGFYDALYFSRVFKKRYNLSPREFRQKAKTTNN